MKSVLCSSGELENKEAVLFTSVLVLLHRFFFTTTLHCLLWNWDIVELLAVFTKKTTLGLFLQAYFNFYATNSTVMKWINIFSPASC